MLAPLKGLVALVAAGLAALSTSVTLGHVHGPSVPHRTALSQPASTDNEVIAGELVSSNPQLPKPTPTPTVEPASDQSSADQSAPAAVPAGPAPAPAPRVAPAPAPPAIVIGSAQQSYINADRAAAGLPPLSWSSCLAGIAAGQSSAMASRGSIFHGNGVNQDFGCGLGSSQTGENVGYWSGGINDAQLNTMFMNSPEHRANIMGPYHYVGTAWVVAANGYGYITVEFA